MKKESLCKERKIGIVIRMLNGAFKHRFMSNAQAAGLDEVSIMNGWILGYLDHNKDRDIYQKTIESEICMGKSSVTGLVKLLEKNEFISRIAVPGDARLKKIVLTQKGFDTANKVKDTLDNMEASMIKGIEKEDMEVFIKVADQIKKNLEEMDCK